MKQGSRAEVDGPTTVVPVYRDNIRGSSAFLGLSPFAGMCWMWTMTMIAETKRNRYRECLRIGTQPMGMEEWRRMLGLSPKQGKEVWAELFERGLLAIRKIDGKEFAYVTRLAKNLDRGKKAVKLEGEGTDGLHSNKEGEGAGLGSNSWTDPGVAALGSVPELDANDASNVSSDVRFASRPGDANDASVVVDNSREIVDNSGIFVDNFVDKSDGEEACEEALSEKRSKSDGVSQEQLYDHAGAQGLTVPFARICGPNENENVNTNGKIFVETLSGPGIEGSSISGCAGPPGPLAGDGGSGQRNGTGRNGTGTVSGPPVEVAGNVSPGVWALPHPSRPGDANDAVASRNGTERCGALLRDGGLTTPARGPGGPAQPEMELPVHATARHRSKPGWRAKVVRDVADLVSDHGSLRQWERLYDAYAESDAGYTEFLAVVSDVKRRLLEQRNLSNPAAYLNAALSKRAVELGLMAARPAGNGSAPRASPARGP